MGEDVKKYIQEGINFSNEFMDMIEDISRKYQEHISVSMEIGHFDKMGKIIMKLSEALIGYNGLIRDFKGEKEHEDEKKRLETILE
ncbi:hypothetical protein BpV2_100c [Bathycoccus sp. RCC1105 virus BpV2]|nr:hypothetical protein BpV2_100c [Bathycoccus sp. RCC1105 virus BpV2]